MHTLFKIGFHDNPRDLVSEIIEIQTAAAGQSSTLPFSFFDRALPTLFSFTTGTVNGLL
jgi:hypothetical protein